MRENQAHSTLAQWNVKSLCLEGCLRRLQYLLPIFITVALSSTSRLKKEWANINDKTIHESTRNDSN